jgi:signal peptidase I
VKPKKSATATIQKNTAAQAPAKAKTQRGFIAEWTVTIILLLFGTTNLVQAFVIPTGSMQDTLLVGDHLLVDKLVYAPAGPISKHLLPYQEIKRGDIFVFRSPADLNLTRSGSRHAGAAGGNAREAVHGCAGRSHPIGARLLHAGGNARPPWIEVDQGCKVGPSAPELSSIIGSQFHESLSPFRLTAAMAGFRNRASAATRRRSYAHDRSPGSHTRHQLH